MHESRFIEEYLIVIWKMSELKAKANPILAIFDPTTQPRAISDELFITALDATKISGTEVPKPIITIPIIIGEILSFLAKPLEPLTR